MRVIGVLVVACAFLLACEPYATISDERTSYSVRVDPNATAPSNTHPASLTVMTWNVKFGAARIDFWFDLWGDTVQMSSDEVNGNLENIYALINEVHPDILVTNEIDINSRRSQYVDMVQGILEHTHLNYAGYVPTWKSRYIPSEGVGRMDMGNAIFSTYPIRSIEGLPLTQRHDQDALTDYFYLHRSVARAVIDLGDGFDVVVLGVHTDAYDTDGTKSQQLREIKDILDAETLPVVIAGDFNAIPPTSVHRSGFNDDNPEAIGTEFETPPYVLADMQPFFDDYVPEITLERYGTTEAEQRNFYSHSIIGPNTIGSAGEPGFWSRKLDYLFVRAPSTWMPGSTDVLQQEGRLGVTLNPLLLSDHAPVVGVWEFER